MMEPPLKLARTIMRQSDVTIVVSHRWKSDQLRPLFVCHLDPVPSRSSFLFLAIRGEREVSRPVLEKLSTAQTDLLVLSAKYITGWFIYREDIYRLVSCRSEEQDIFVLSFWNWLASGESFSLSVCLCLCFSLFSSLSAKDEQGNINRIRNTFDAQCDTTLSPVCRMCLFITRRNGCLRRFTYFYDPTCF